MSEPRAVATGSGRAAKFISARFAVILFREVSFLIRGDFLIRSLPLCGSDNEQYSPGGLASKGLKAALISFTPA